jgi:glycerol-3-phosphate acyltransferase PlsY
MAMMVWVLTAVTLRVSSLSALCSLISLPFIYFFYGESDVKIYFGIILGLLIVLRHRSNIHKLIKRTEPRIGDSVK